MTQEEKARAYDEALERAKNEWSNNLDNAYKNYRERLEIIFPELAESEDEKIKREHKQLAEWLKELNQWQEDYTNHKIGKAALCLEIQGIIDRLDSIFNLLNERLPIRLVPFTDTYPRPIEPLYKSLLNDVQANTGKEEEE